MPAFIDLPDSPVSSFEFMTAGWIATSSAAPQIGIRINGREVRHQLYPRPDVHQALGGSEAYITGVIASPDLLELDAPKTLAIELSCSGDSATKDVFVDAEVLSQLPDEMARRRRTRAWCLEHLRCAACGYGSTSMRVEYNRVECLRCRTVCAQSQRAINMISSELRGSSNIFGTQNVSSNPYDPTALALIQETTEARGWVLDCGAGARSRRMDRVVNLEIVDYFSTDVLAVGESLPFASNSFDAALSLAVLEHVRDPFKCARELVRVVKPGGRIMASVPFLQPVHGYPDHYYNMTQTGLMNLFSDVAEVESCTVPLHGHPIFALQWLTAKYLEGLPEASRQSFQQMTLNEVARIVPAEFLSQPAASTLPQDNQAVIACLNTLIATKR